MIYRTYEVTAFGHAHTIEIEGEDKEVLDFALAYKLADVLRDIADDWQISEGFTLDVEPLNDYTCGECSGQGCQKCHGKGVVA